jgi:hypothetical protein
MAIISSRAGTFLCFMRPRISLPPIPPMFIFERASFWLPRGIIQPKAFSMRFLPRPPTFSGLRRAFSPQKVKNIVTLRPMDRAPLAMMKLAMV